MQYLVVAQCDGAKVYASCRNMQAAWSENPALAYVYDERDPRETKLTWWRAIAGIRGMDRESVQVEEYNVALS